MVESPTYGRGLVLEEWGVFFTCRDCLRLIDIPRRVGHDGRHPTFKPTKCCNTGVLLVSGKNIFDVRFGNGKTHSINEAHLKLV